MKYIINANIVLEREIVENGVLMLDGERIAGVYTADAITVPKDADIIDAEGAYVGPGFVDIHVHGGNGALIFNSPLPTVSHFLSHGETTVLSALYYDLTKEEFLKAIDTVQSAMKEDGAGRALKGFYMEGPYMNPKYGASAEKNKWKGAITEADYAEIVKAAGKDAKVWVVAPEREGIEEFVRYAKCANPSAVIGVGHSEATPDEIAALKKYGLRLHTHLMNATGRIPTLSGTRSCGPDEACLMDKEAYAEVICDSQGMHVHPDMCRMILAVKGVYRVVLISDSFANDEPSPPELAHITDLTFDANGDLCGSRLTLDAACRNMMAHTGCSMNDAFIMASLNPARVIGMDKEIGSIEIGKRADLVFVDGDFNVKKVLIGGENI